MFVSLGLAGANVLQCNFSVRSTWNVVNAYTCIGNIVMRSNSPTITSVTGVHAVGRSNADVQAVVIEGHDIRLFPRGFEVAFPKVQAISLNGVGISEISQADLAAFPNLVQLQLNDNAITEIRRLTFDSSPDLQFISINNNPLRHVAQNVFDNLRKLSVFELRNTVCLNESGQNRNDVQTLLFRVFQSCPPTSAMIKEDVLGGYNLTQVIERELEQHLVRWEARFLSLERQINHQLERLNILENVLIDVIRVLNKVVETVNQMNYARG